MRFQNQKSTLLLVDDDVQMRMLLTLLLGRIGYEVRVAEDGFSALRAMRHTLPQTILSDLHMPGMSGFEFLSVVRHRFPEVRVIAMSAGFSGHQVPEGVAADGFYAKSSEIEDLMGLLAATPLGEHLCRAQCDSDAIPHWLPQNGYDEHGNACITIHCPECMRNFQHTRDEVSGVIQQAACIYCSFRVPYAIVQQEASTFFSAAAPMQKETCARV